MGEFALTLKGQDDISLILSALQREKDLLLFEIQKIEGNLVEFEKKHGIPSDQFIDRYSKGEMGDGDDVMTWAGEFQFYQRFQEKLHRLEELISECQKHIIP